MITGLLCAVVVWSMLWGVGAPWTSMAAAVTCGAVLCLPGAHFHGIVVDVYARCSKLSRWNPAVKTAGCLLLLCACVAQRSPVPPLVLGLAVSGVTVRGGLDLRVYLRLLRLPLGFLLLSALALLWRWSASGIGLCAVPLFSGWLVLTEAAQETARLVTARAFGALCCLYLLSLSTPLPEILDTLRRWRIPDVVIELAMLMYRYLFVLLETHRTMRSAAESRLGYSGLRRSLRTTGKVYAGLLGSSLRKANACYDAMESRCYRGTVRFLTEKKPITAGEATLFGVLFLAMAAALLL